MIKNPFSVAFFLLLIAIVSITSDQAKAFSLVLESGSHGIPIGISSNDPEDNSPRSEEKVPDGIIPKKSQEFSGLESSLEELQKAFSAEGWFAAAQVAGKSGLDLVNGVTKVIISTEKDKGPEVSAALSNLSINVEGSYGDLVQATVPP